MLCKKKKGFPMHSSSNDTLWSHLVCSSKTAGCNCYLTPVLIPLFQVNNWYVPPCTPPPSHTHTHIPPLLLCQVTSSLHCQPDQSCTNTGQPSENASAGSHSNPDNISDPQPHSHWHEAATQIELQMATSMSQSKGGWDTGHPPAGCLVLPLIDRYLILDGDSGVLSRAGH